MNTQGPQFSPVKGVGSIWKDPKTGETWRYEAGGWVKLGSDIQTETKEKGTFEVKPEEEEIVSQLKAGGSSEEQIQQGLAERRRILANLSQQETTATTATTSRDTSNPFGGMTKQEMLRDAFNNGVRDPGELEKLEKLYDKLVGEEEGGTVTLSEQIKNLPTASERQKAQAIADLLSVIRNAKEKVEGVSTGPVAGRKGLLEYNVFGKSTAQGELEQSFSEILRTIRKESTGVAFSPEEVQDLLKEVPKITQQETPVKEKLARLEQRMLNKLNLMGIADPEMDGSQSNQTDVKMDVSDFAKLVRSKAPGGTTSDGKALAAMSDEELTKKVLEEHPEYESLVDTKETDKKTWSQKVIDIPILGDIAGTIIPSVTGAMARITQPKVQKEADELFRQSRELTAKAKETQDPAQKKALLDRARELSEQAGELTEKFQETVEAGGGYFTEYKGESPDTLAERLGAYAPQATRTAVAAGTLLAPAVSGVFSPATSLWGRVGTRTVEGATLNFINGLAKEDEATVTERLINGGEYSLFGAVIGTTFGLGEEAVRGLLNSSPKEIIKKLNLPRKWGEDLEKVAKEYKDTINTEKVRERLKERIMEKESTATRDKLLKMVDSEDFGDWTLWKTIQRKRGAGYRPDSPAVKNVYNEYLRQELRRIIHEVSPEIAKLDKQISTYYKVSDPMSSLIRSKLLRILGVYKVFDALF